MRPYRLARFKSIFKGKIIKNFTISWLKQMRIVVGDAHVEHGHRIEAHKRLLGCFVNLGIRVKEAHRVEAFAWLRQVWLLLERLEWLLGRVVGCFLERWRRRRRARSAFFLGSFFERHRQMQLTQRVTRVFHLWRLLQVLIGDGGEAGDFVHLGGVFFVLFDIAWRCVGRSLSTISVKRTSALVNLFF